jgi:SAM-dependent methyltransferase
VEVIEAAFETWRPPGVAAFDLVFAATAWHWIDPAVKYRRAWDLLRPGGHLAFWAATHVFPAGGDPFFRDIQDVYHEIREGLPPAAAGHSRESCPTTRPRSRAAACSST